MAKESKSKQSLVVDAVEGSEVPFLRGVLTRSLQSAGLSFEEAYRIASLTRQGLIEKTITTTALRKRVVAHLIEAGHGSVVDRYTHAQARANVLWVEDETGQRQPFSRTRLGQSLQLCALSDDQRRAITVDIEQKLLRAGQEQVYTYDLTQIVYEYILTTFSSVHAHRYLVWLTFSRSNRSLIVIVGGATGSGKSTISSEIAHRLNIVRTQSTDMLREVMRLMIPERLMPSLYTSSYNTWQALPVSEGNPVSFKTHFVDGYLTQAEQVGIGIEGVVRRAEREQVSLVVEGVHVHPALQCRLRDSVDAIVVPLILAVLKKKALLKRLAGRHEQVPSRRVQRVLEHFDAIWQLQSFLLSEADALEVPIIANTDSEETMISIMETIALALEQALPVNAETFFANLKL